MTHQDYLPTSSPLWVRGLNKARSWLSCHPLLCVFLIAFAARLGVALVIAVTRDGSLFPDDHGYLNLLNEYQLGQTGSWDYFNTRSFWNANSGFLWPISRLFRLFGFHPILGQTLSALAGATVAVAVTPLVRRHASTVSALVSGLAVA